MTMKPKSKQVTPAIYHHAPKTILDDTYSFAGIYFRPHAMIFARRTSDGSTEFRHLSFEEGLAQPLTLIDANPEGRTEILETILWEKTRRNLPGQSGSRLFLETFDREFQERFGFDSPMVKAKLESLAADSEAIHD